MKFNTSPSNLEGLENVTEIEVIMERKSCDYHTPISSLYYKCFMTEY